MRKERENKLQFVYNLPSGEVTTETVLGVQCFASYMFRMYFGPTRVTARYKHHSDLVEIKAYGLLVVRTLSFDKQIPSNVANRLEYLGYEIVDTLNIAVLNKDFGYITAQNYEVNYLMHKLQRVIHDWEAVCKAIREETSSWGDPVLDVNGRLVYGDEPGSVKRDPFAKAGRLALKKKLGAYRFNPLNSIKNALTDKKDSGEGVDM